MDSRTWMLARGGLVVALVLAACAPPMDPIDIDLEPPYVLGLQPSGNAVPADVEFTIRFSEPIQERTIFWFDEDLGESLPEGIALALGDDEEYVKKAIDNPPLSVTQRKKVIPITVTLNAARDTLTVRPLRPLEGLTDYVFLVSRKIRDDHSNGLIREPGARTPETQRLRFTTAPAPDLTPPVATLRSPAPGSQGVSIELTQVEVAFSEELDERTLTPDRIGLKTRATNETVFAKSVAIDGLRAVFQLDEHPSDGCEKLCQDVEYVLWVSGRVADLAGNGMSPIEDDQGFRSARCIDVDPPRIAPASVVIKPSDTNVTVTWTTDEASTSRVFLAQGDADAFADACAQPDGEHCVVVDGPDATCQADVCELPESSAQWNCEHSVTLTGLEPSTAYSLRVESADPGRRSARGAVESFATLAPLPKVVVNEVFATPQGFSAVNAGKFIELFNAGVVDVDLSGWKLMRCADAQCTAPEGSKWVLKAGKDAPSTVLVPGAYAVAAGDAFDWDKMGVPSDAVRLAGSTATLLSNGVVSTSAKTYALLTPDDLIISSYGGWLGAPNADSSKTKNNGRSFERRDAALPDEATNWKTGATEITTAPGNYATPGSKNSASP